MIISVLFLILEAYTYNKYLVPHYIKTFYDTTSQDSYLIVALNCIIIVQKLQYQASELQITFGAFEIFAFLTYRLLISDPPQCTIWQVSIDYQ